MSKKSARPVTPVVSVLNMKGGVGKTTISAHLSRVVFGRRAVRTLLVDVDPQFNLTQTLLTRVRYDELKKEGKTIFGAMEAPSSGGLFEVRVLSGPPPTPTDIGVSLRQVKKRPLVIVPGDFRLVKYSLMDDNRKLDAVRTRFSHFVSNASKEFDFVCLDCNPSSSFLTLCALHACTHILVPVRLDRYSILGLELVSDFVDSVPSISPKPKIVVVINGVPRKPGLTRVERDLRAHPVFGPLTLVNRIPESSLLVANPDYTGFATERPVPWKKLLESELSMVADELCDVLGIS